ncbi:gas vesicle protein [Streptomyces sp. KK5PA1]|uniref:Gas vesicle protein n=2 Tax=Actinacidiphila acididurans TaxID=2784346 RepID=A0ABS2TSL2_9ACTN|nr:gas vesicle protein [Actinacidiphila acididurans]
MAPTAGSPYGQPPPGANLADILERVLDKGVVIAGDIRINLLDIELLTIKLRLLVASVDKAKEMGIDWWEHDPSLSHGARRRPSAREVERDTRDEVERDGRREVPAGESLAEENDRLRAELARLRSDTRSAADEAPAAEPHEKRSQARKEDRS